MLKPGDTAPDFTAPDHTGKATSLAALRGKNVVLWFYPKADTPGCTAEGCSFRDLSADFAKKNAVILGVSFDDQAANAAFHKKFHFTFPLLCDTERALGLAYGACTDAKAATASRIGVVIDGAGKVRAYYPKVDARTWPAEVIQTL